MKTIWKYLLILFIKYTLTQSTCIAQVNFEHDYLMDQEFFLTNLGNNDFKYVIFDRNNSRFSLYNLDHSNFLMNIQIPFQVDDTVANAHYQLGYVTKSLFDCDSTNIEYAIMLNTPFPNKHPNTAVYRTDGTLIFSKDSVGTMFCIGCGSGSYEIHPIMNTPVGAKMYFFRHDSTGATHVLIYGLCDELPQEITEVNQTDKQFVKIFPNPSTGKINFDIDLPSSYEEFELVILNSSFLVIKSEPIRGIKTHMDFDNESLSSGTYFFSLQKKEKVFQIGKFIITK